MEAYLGFVGQHLEPGEAVGVGPDGVVDAGEVDVELGFLFSDEVRQEEGELVLRQRVFRRVGELVPVLGVARQLDRLGRRFQDLGLRFDSSLLRRPPLD